MSKSYYLLQVKVPKAKKVQLEPLLNEYVSWGWQERTSHGLSEYLIHCKKMDQINILKKKFKQSGLPLKISTKKVRANFWKDSWKRYFQPQLISEKFLILPFWEKYLSDDPRLVPIYINPQMAFGTGQHPSTQLCLQALANLNSQKKLKNDCFFLDLGTGSGILGIASSILGYKGLGLDNDPLIVNNALENVEKNKVKNFQILTGDISCLKVTISFDLIFANILANPLVKMAPEICGFLADTGFLILSGIVHEQEDRLIQAYSKQGLSSKPNILRRGEWSALVWQKK